MNINMTAAYLLQMSGGLDDAVRKRQKFAPFLKADYKYTFSERRNVSPEFLVQVMQTEADKEIEEEQYELTVTEKEDGVAVMLVVVWQKVDISEIHSNEFETCVPVKDITSFLKEMGNEKQNNGDPSKLNKTRQNLTCYEDLNKTLKP